MIIVKFVTIKWQTIEIKNCGKIGVVLEKVRAMMRGWRQSDEKIKTMGRYCRKIEEENKKYIFFS